MNILQNYFFNQFPQELLAYSNANPAPAIAGHPSQLMHKGAVIIRETDEEEEHLLQDHEMPFRFSWYAVAFLDWGLRSHFPEKFQLWITKSGGSPFPVTLHDGTPTSALPHQILSGREETVSEWKEFCSLYLQGIIHYLNIATVTPKDFFTTLAKSEQWDFTNDLFDEILIEAAVKEFGIEGVFTG